MNWMQRRRAAMMGGKKEKAISLADGLYMSSKLTVSNGKNIDIQSPAIWSNAVIPLTREIPVSNGDELSIMFLSHPGTKNQTWAVRVSDSNIAVASATKPFANQWYGTTLDADGTLTGIYVQCREVGWIANFDLSLKINDEVIF